LVDGGVLGDADFSPEWQPLAAMCGLDAFNWRNVERVRDAFVAAILPEFQEAKAIRIQYARILGLLNNYLWIWQHLSDPSSWPAVRDLVAEDY
jgi:hypothetical protein